MKLITSLKRINIFKSRVFGRIARQYFFMLVGFITVLFFIFHSVALQIQQEKTNNLKNGSLVLQSELVKEQNIVDTLTNELFIQQPSLEDLRQFLALDYVDYFEYKTKLYMESDSSNYYGTLTFIKKIFYSYPTCETIVFYTPTTNTITTFSNHGNLFLNKEQATSQTSDLFTQQLKASLRTENQETSNYLVFQKSLNNPATLDTIAEMYYIFDNTHLYQDVDKKVQDSSGEVALIDDTTVLFSTGAKVEEPFDDIQTFGSQLKLVTWQNPTKLRSFSIHIYIYFILIAISILFISFPLLARQLKRIDQKIFAINEKMKLIQQGEFEPLAVPYPTKQPDEFSLILQGLDQMGEELAKYIDKVYVSEIKQKNYQMKTIRAQINPHFLYNTLEAIRMKAVLNSDFSVAEMLYNTSQLYRNMIKGKEFITLKEELMFCDTYLRLFEIRFEDKMFYDISFDKGLEDLPIEKLSIQPFVENYILHGIDSDKNDNFIEITCEVISDTLVISVQDNGKGISQDKLLAVQEKLASNSIDDSDSMGLLNVNFRVKELFGETYGVSIISNEWGGVSVTLLLPVQTRSDEA